jgi:hypothetical protein
VWRWRRFASADEGLGEGLRAGGVLNARGAQENLWPKSSLERPVARHFVWALYSTWDAVSNPLKIQELHSAGFVVIALGRERFTSARDGGQGRGRMAVERAKRPSLCTIVWRGKWKTLR